MRVLELLAVCCLAAADAGTPSAFDGTWKIDTRACSDLTPMLEHYGANFFIRKFAGSVSPTDIITWKNDRFDLEVKSVFFNRKTTVFLDGKTKTADDLLGNPYEYTSVVEDGAVVSKGTITREDGSTERFDLKRTLESDGTMVTRMTIFPKGGKALEVKRVFRRQPAN